MRQAIIKEDQKILDGKDFRTNTQSYLVNNYDLAFEEVAPILELAGFTRRIFSELLLTDLPTAYRVFQLAYLALNQKQETWKLEILDSREDYV